MQKRTALLFDMDGTMLDNMKYHLKAWEKIAAETGSDLHGDALFKELYGKNTEILERIVGKNRFSKEEISKLVKKKDEYYREFYKPHLELIAGLKELLEEAKEEHVLLAIATGGPNQNIDFAIDHLGLRPFFEVLVSGEDVDHSKPYPETFLKAANLLNILPSNCIVFEDTPKGIEAAQHAGMRAVAVLTSHKKADFDPFPNVVKTISDFRLLKLQELI